MIDYGKLSIPRRARHCSEGNELFVPGMDYISLIIEEPKELVRRDFCTTCWEHVSKQIPTKIYWKAKLPEKENINPEVLSRYERGLNLLRELDDAPTAFVLALYLARKKKLILRQDIEHAMIYEVPETEEMIVVKKVELSQLEVEKIQQTLHENAVM